MAAKDKVERGFRFLYDDSGGTERDLSTGLVRASASGFGLIYEEADMTGVSNGVVNFLANHPTASISATFHMDDTATTGAHVVLSASSGVVGTLTARWGSAGAAPTTGDPMWSGEYLNTGVSVGFDGGKAVINVTFVAGSATAPVWSTYSP